MLRIKSMFGAVRAVCANLWFMVSGFKIDLDVYNCLVGVQVVGIDNMSEYSKVRLKEELNMAD